MKSILLSISLIGLLNSCKHVKKDDGPFFETTNTQEIVFHTEDSLKIYGNLYELSKNNPIILLFHQGGSNGKGEYSSIVPQLLNEGFNVLTIDQRLGGQVYGNYNRTIADIENNNFNYCDAYSDLEGALNFVIDYGFKGKIILWGSSYSASLTIKLANEYQERVNGALAFSPASGDPMRACLPDDYFKTLKIPLLVLRPAQEMERESAKRQFELAQVNHHQTFVAKNGTHGSSMLVEKRVGSNVDENWKTVISFLKKLKN